MKKKLFTLAVPTYNMETYLARCLESVVCDNMDYLEVLVVNDGSKDRSSEIAHEYEKKYPNVIRVIDKENGNYGSCVNRALAEAKGKYFRMLDADDWCNTEALNTLLGKLKKCDADMVLTISEDRDADGQILCCMEAPERVIPNVVYEIKEFDGVSLGYIDLFCSHIITYKTEILRSIGLKLQHGISYTDNEYVFFPMDHVHTVIYYDLPIYQYFVGREGQTTDPKIMAKSVGQIMQVLDRLWDYFITHRDNQLLSVTNNQRILLAEMIWWIYRVAFAGIEIKKMKPLVEIIGMRIKQDKELSAVLARHTYYKYGLDVIAYYHETGRFVDHPITKCNLMYHRITRFICRKLGIKNTNVV